MSSKTDSITSTSRHAAASTSRHAEETTNNNEPLLNKIKWVVISAFALLGGVFLKYILPTSHQGVRDSGDSLIRAARFGLIKKSTRSKAIELIKDRLFSRTPGKITHEKPTKPTPKSDSENESTRIDQSSESSAEQYFNVSEDGVDDIDDPEVDPIVDPKDPILYRPSLNNAPVVLAGEAYDDNVEKTLAAGLHSKSTTFGFKSPFIHKTDGVTGEYQRIPLIEDHFTRR